MNKKDLRRCKKQILKFLTEDFDKNQAIFDKKDGWQIFDGTDLEMVMDKVVAGLYAAYVEEENNG